MVRRLFIVLFLVLWSSSAAVAEPFSLLLLRILRDQIVMSSARAGIEAMSRQDKSRGLAAAAPAPRSSAPLNEAERLKAVIDENLGYLPAAQREEVHTSLMRMLSDPQNADLRPVIIEEFTHKAMLVGQAQRALGSLSYAEKKALAANAVGEYRKLPAEEQREIVEQLRAGIGYIPRDLSDMLLAEFGRVGN